MQQFEIAPPPSVWARISAQLDSEFVAEDADVALKLEQTAVLPPPGTWDKINAQLQDDTAAEVKKPIPLIYRRLAVAALVTGILLTAGLLFLNNKKDIALPGNTVVNTVPENVAPPVNNTTPTLATVTSPSVSERKVSAKPAKKRIISQLINEATETTYIQEPEQAPLYELQTVSALQPVTISAPPLRDTKGNIILIASLITRPDDEYIAVTGPNGKQTKISCKFLGCLSYINETLTSSELDSKGIRCKAQFEEWRKKILSQPAFIPTANNFFDIFELKDMIQEM